MQNNERRDRYRFCAVQIDLEWNLHPSQAISLFHCIRFTHSFHFMWEFSLLIFLRLVLFFFSLSSVKKREILFINLCAESVSLFENFSVIVIWFMAIVFSFWGSKWKESIDEQNGIESQPFLCTLIKTQLGQLFRFQWISHSSTTHSLPSSLHA